jgi:DNA invertase Pin-like site-specific DNA recombinase
LKNICNFLLYKTRKKVVLLLRVSTCSQDYEYQRNTLTELCRRNGWQIVHTVENKVSGAKKNENREEIIELLNYVKNNEVDIVVASEVSRLGRDTLEALKIIEILNENKVNLYFANYGIETLLPNAEVNPIARLLLTICLEISSYERNLIRYRMKAGYEDYLKRRKENPNLRLGRQGYMKDEKSYREDYPQELSLLRKGISLRNIQKITGTSLGTLQKIKKFL